MPLKSGNAVQDATLHCARAVPSVRQHLGATGPDLLGLGGGSPIPRASQDSKHSKTKRGLRIGKTREPSCVVQARQRGLVQFTYCYCMLAFR
jgi:hypothetical protein